MANESPNENGNENILAWLDENHRSLRRSGAARSVVLRRRYRFAVHELWDACTDRKRLSRWFAHVKGELAVGATLAIDAGMPQPITARVVACEPQKRVVITWSYDGDPVDPPDEVEARFSADADGDAERGSVLELEHRSTVEYPWAPGVGSGWESWLWGLDRTLGGAALSDEVRGAPDDINALIDARWNAPHLAEATAVLVRDGARNRIRCTRRYHKPRHEVWSALVATFDRWYPARMQGPTPLHEGAAVRFLYEDGTSLAGRITAFAPPSLIAFTEEGDDVRIELRAEARGNATLLVFTHSFDAASTLPTPSVATGWDMCLDDITRALHQQSPLSEADHDARRDALRAEYARLWG